MKIRKATKKDIKEIAKIYREGFIEEPFNEKWTLKEAINKINIFSRYCDIWILIEKKIIGFIIINPNFWKIGELIFGEDLVIKKEYQHKGYGTKLFEYVFDYYKKRGYKKFMGIINKDAKSFGFIKKLNLEIQKQDILIEKELK
jgi:aminoglycoside 6'-N-acetyltransferase I